MFCKQSKTSVKAQTLPRGAPESDTEESILKRGIVLPGLVYRAGVPMAARRGREGRSNHHKTEDRTRNDIDSVDSTAMMNWSLVKRTFVAFGSTRCGKKPVGMGLQDTCVCQSV